MYGFGLGKFKLLYSKAQVKNTFPAIKLLVKKWLQLGMDAVFFSWSEMIPHKNLVFITVSLTTHYWSAKSWLAIKQLLQRFTQQRRVVWFSVTHFISIQVLNSPAVDINSCLSNFQIEWSTLFKINSMLLTAELNQTPSQIYKKVIRAGTCDRSIEIKCS